MENNINQVVKDINEYFESSGKSHFQGDILDYERNKEDKNILIIIASLDEDPNSQYSIPIPAPPKTTQLNTILFLLYEYKIFINLENNEHTPPPDIYIEEKWKYNNMNISLFISKERWEF